MTTSYDTVTVPAEEYDALKARAARASAEAEQLYERCRTYERSLKALSGQQARTEAVRAEAEAKVARLSSALMAAGVSEDMVRAILAG